jgi:hypothetical protein
VFRLIKSLAESFGDSHSIESQGVSGIPPKTKIRTHRAPGARRGQSADNATEMHAYRSGTDF